MGLETSEPLEAQTVALDGVFAQKSLSFAQKAIGELEQFDVFFDNLQKFCFVLKNISLVWYK